MTRRIKERQDRTTIRGYLIGTDMLGNATGFAGNNLRIPDRIKQRSLTVVNVTHNGNDRRTCFQIFRLFFDHLQNIFDVRVRDTHNSVTKFFDNQFSGVSVNGLVLCRHDAICHQRFHNISNALGHPVGKLRNGNGFWQCNLAEYLFTLSRHTHRLSAGFVLLTLHRSH